MAKSFSLKPRENRILAGNFEPWILEGDIDWLVEKYGELFPKEKELREFIGLTFCGVITDAIEKRKTELRKTLGVWSHGAEFLRTLKKQYAMFGVAIQKAIDSNDVSRCLICGADRESAKIGTEGYAARALRFGLCRRCSREQDFLQSLLKLKW